MTIADVFSALTEWLSQAPKDMAVWMVYVSEEEVYIVSLTYAHRPHIFLRKYQSLLPRPVMRPNESWFWSAFQHLTHNLGGNRPDIIALIGPSRAKAGTILSQEWAEVNLFEVAYDGVTPTNPVIMQALENQSIQLPYHARLKVFPRLTTLDDGDDHFRRDLPLIDIPLFAPNANIRHNQPLTPRDIGLKIAVPHAPFHLIVELEDQQGKRFLHYENLSAQDRQIGVRPIATIDESLGWRLDWVRVNTHALYIDDQREPTLVRAKIKTRVPKCVIVIEGNLGAQRRLLVKQGIDVTENDKNTDFAALQYLVERVLKSIHSSETKTQYQVMFYHDYHGSDLAAPAEFNDIDLLLPQSNLTYLYGDDRFVSFDQIMKAIQDDFMSQHTTGSEWYKPLEVAAHQLAETDLQGSATLVIWIGQSEAHHHPDDQHKNSLSSPASYHLSTELQRLQTQDLQSISVFVKRDVPADWLQSSRRVWKSLAPSDQLCEIGLANTAQADEAYDQIQNIFQDQIKPNFHIYHTLTIPQEHHYPFDALTPYIRILIDPEDN